MRSRMGVYLPLALFSCDHPNAPESKFRNQYEDNYGRVTATYPRLNLAQTAKKRLYNAHGLLSEPVYGVQSAQ